MIVCKWPSCEHVSTDHEPKDDWEGWAHCLLCDCPGYHSSPPRLQPKTPPSSTFGQRKKEMRKESKRRAASRKNKEPQRDLCRTLTCCIEDCPVGAEPHHYPISRGRGGGDKGNVTPLCPAHHSQFHTIGQETFQSMYSINLTAVALSLIPHAYPDREVV